MSISPHSLNFVFSKSIRTQPSGTRGIQEHCECQVPLDSRLASVLWDQGVLDRAAQESWQDSSRLRLSCSLVRCSTCLLFKISTSDPNQRHNQYWGGERAHPTHTRTHTITHIQQISCVNRRRRGIVAVKLLLWDHCCVIIVVGSLLWNL